MVFRGRLNVERVGWSRKKILNLLVVGLCVGLFLGKLPWVFSAFRQITYLEYADAPASEAIVSDGEATEIYLDRGIGSTFTLKESVSLRLAEGAVLPVQVVLLDKDGRKLANFKPERGTDEEGNTVLRLTIPSFTGAGLSGAQKIRMYAEEEVPYDAQGITNVRVYGGARDLLAIIWAIAEEILLLGLLVYAVRAYREGENLLEKHIFLAVLLAVVSFSVRYVLTTNLAATVADENETLLAAFVQRGGGVLYRDYVTLHMPLTYWLSGLYALFGATTAVHFRLFFQLTICIVWSLVYYRHRGTGVRWAAALISVLWGPVTYLFIGDNAFHVLPDQLAALAMSVIFLELHGYSRDHRLRIDRAAVLSAGIFFAIQSSILVIFPLIAVLAFLAAEELRYSRKRLRRMPRGYYKRRYLWPIGIIAAAFVIAWAIMAIQGSLGEAFSQTVKFTFGTYSKYIGFSGTPLKFLFSGFANIGQLFTSTFAGSFEGELLSGRIVQCILVLAAFAAAVLEGMRYGWPRAVTIIFVFETLAARNAVRFHSLMFWAVIILFLLTRIPEFSAGVEVLPVRRRKGQPVSPEEQEPSAKAARSRLPWKVRLGLAGAFCLLFLLIFGIPYISMAFRSLKAGPVQVSAAELTAVRRTQPGKTVFIDSNVLTSCYVPSKGRLPVNRACAVLPWYCEVYENEMVETLRSEAPDVMLYRTKPVVWEYSDYASALDEAVNALYIPGGADGLFIRSGAAAG